MKIEIKIPEVGESVQEGLLSQWYRQNADRVRKGDILLLLETDKVTVEVAAEAEPKLRKIVLGVLAEGGRGKAEGGRKTD